MLTTRKPAPCLLCHQDPAQTMDIFKVTAVPCLVKVRLILSSSPSPGKLQTWVWLPPPERPAALWDNWRVNTALLWRWLLHLQWTAQASNDWVSLCRFNCSNNHLNCTSWSSLSSPALWRHWQTISCSFNHSKHPTAWSVHVLSKVYLADRLHIKKTINFLKVVTKGQKKLRRSRKQNDTRYAGLR